MKKIAICNEVIDGSTHFLHSLEGIHVCEATFEESINPNGFEAMIDAHNKIKRVAKMYPIDYAYDFARDAFEWALHDECYENDEIFRICVRISRETDDATDWNAVADMAYYMTGKHYTCVEIKDGWGRDYTIVYDDGLHTDAFIKGEFQLKYLDCGDVYKVEVFTDDNDSGETDVCEEVEVQVPIECDNPALFIKEATGATQAIVRTCTFLYTA